jgi:5-methylcytosine-specific restriction endonuclease McrA
MAVSEGTANTVSSGKIKKCRECGVEGPWRNSYCTYKNGGNGCDAKRAKGYYDEHKEERKDYHKGVRTEKKKKAKRQASYEQNAERRKAAARRYYAAHRNERLAYFRSARGRLVNARSNALRRARMLSHPESVPYTRDEIIERDHQTCWICEQFVPDDDLHLDHLIPIQHGGPDCPDNVAVAHKVCNLTRSKRLFTKEVSAMVQQMGVKAFQSAVPLVTPEEITGSGTDVGQ